MKIGILTFHNAINYGAVLQTYALQETCKKFGEVYVINYMDPLIADRYKNIKPSGKDLKSILRCLISNCILFLNKREFLKFRCKFLKETNIINDIAGLKNLDNYYDCIIVGSDQVWNLELTNNEYTYFLNFANKSRKVSYAASFGVRSYPNAKMCEIIKYLKQFNSISVREKHGEYMLRERGIDAHTVLDPTLLLTKEQWTLISRRPINCPNKYILIYGFSVSDEMFDCAFEKAKELQCKIVLIGNYVKSPRNNIKLFRNVSPAQWIYLFLNTEYIITNSFHGVAFSINFNRKFRPYDSVMKTTETNSRIESILTLFSLDNLLNSNEDFEFDFKKINFILDKNRKESLSYLSNALESHE